MTPDGPTGRGGGGSTAQSGSLRGPQHTLSRRVTIAVTGVTGVMVILAAVGIWLDTRWVLLGQVDRELAQTIEHLRLREQDPLPDPRPARVGLPRNDRLRQIQIIDLATGREVFRSAGLPPGDALISSLATPQTALTASGHPYRVQSLVVERTPNFLDTTGFQGPLEVRFGLDLTPVDDELQRMAISLAAIAAVAIGLAGMAARILLATVLRPVRELAEAIGHLGPDDLAARVPASAGPAELTGIVDRLNALLDRLEQAFRREQATIANIAHELRTPVTVLRTTLEFRQLAGPGPAEAAVLATCLETVARMQAQVANLLQLARLEAGKEPLDLDEVDAVLLIEDAIAPWTGRAAAKQQHFSRDLPPGLDLRTAPGPLLQILDNLVGNAVTHGPAGSGIHLHLASPPAGGLLLRITNSCADALDVTQLGKAFYRGDTARRAADHNGLGLALCRRLAGLLGGALTLQAGGGTFAAELRLPAN